MFLRVIRRWVPLSASVRKTSSGLAANLRMSPRPPVDESLAVSLLKRLFPVADEEDPVVLREFPSYDDRNFHVRLRLAGDESPRECVLKVFHEKFSGDAGFQEAQTAVALAMAKLRIQCPVPIQSRTGSYYCMEKLKRDHEDAEKATLSLNAVRLVTFISGVTMKTLGTPSHALLTDVGRCAADVASSLQALQGTAAGEALLLHQAHSIWSIADATQCECYIPSIPDQQIRQIVQAIMDRYKRDVVPHMKAMPQGVLHGDLNDQNIILNPGSRDVVHGVIDIGDAIVAPLVADLGICLSYMSHMFLDTPAESIASVVKGYCQRRPLDALEKETLHLWVLTRLAQTISLGYDSYSKEPGNKYLLDSVHPACVVLPKLFALSPADVQRLWYSSV